MSTRGSHPVACATAGSCSIPAPLMLFTVSATEPKYPMCLALMAPWLPAAVADAEALAPDRHSFPDGSHVLQTINQIIIPINGISFGIERCRGSSKEKTNKHGKSKYAVNVPAPPLDSSGESRGVVVEGPTPAYPRNADGREQRREAWHTGAHSFPLLHPRSSREIKTQNAAPATDASKSAGRDRPDTITISKPFIGVSLVPGILLSCRRLLVHDTSKPNSPPPSEPRSALQGLRIPCRGCPSSARTIPLLLPRFRNVRLLSLVFPAHRDRSPLKKPKATARERSVGSGSLAGGKSGPRRSS
eukprot:scaffold7031_cov254-Pinguiococcus_pyrenoidosus.AAC.9